MGLSTRLRLKPYLLTVAACSATTLVATPLLEYLDLANIVMLFLLTVLLVAVKLGRRAAILASILSVLLFDLFFVPPRFSLAVSNIQYLVTFVVMLVTALITTHLTTGLKQKAREAEQREKQTHALYQLAKALAGAPSTTEAIEKTRAFVWQALNARCEILLPEADQRHLFASQPATDLQWEPHLARTALSSGERVRSDEVMELGLAPLYFPLKASVRTHGVLAVSPVTADVSVLEHHFSLLEAMASLLATALERFHYVDIAQENVLKVQTERLRSSILSALSHDLRTPLTVMVGLAESLSLVKPALPSNALETAHALREHATRLAGLVSNLLDMARLNAGNITLRKEWQPLEEVVGSSIQLLGKALNEHPLNINLPAHLPLLQFDAVLIERVLCNLLENAAKYAPTGTAIKLSASQNDSVVTVSIRDHGPGFPTARQGELFDMFVRGQHESRTPGTGLGLAICRAILEAHQGEIHAENAPDGGANIHFTLPIGNPPSIEEEST